MLEEIEALEKESEALVERIKTISDKITEIRKNCNHSFIPYDGWFTDTHNCIHCGKKIRKPSA